MPGFEKTYPADLPPTRGHFPGNPIIPGAWLLADALATVAGEFGWALGACTVKNAKFLSPARPGERVQIEYTLGSPDSLKLECTVNGSTVLSAQVTCPQSPTAA
ncbi:MAG: hypothetical protein JWN73_1681 [Betaproteobacteria bacterium]|nr:hypothetical protein [Betaproteobacteria bacterium]